MSADDKEKREKEVVEHKESSRRHRKLEESTRSRSPTTHRDKRRRTKSPPPSTRIPEEPDLYKIDVKGDPANITYGTSYRYSIPAFHRFGAGFVLGLPSQWRIDRDKGEGQGLVIAIRGYDSNKRRKGGNLFSVDASRVGRLKVPRDIVKGFLPNEEFIPLTHVQSGKTVENEPVAEKDYRSLEGKAKSTALEDVEPVSSEDEEKFSYSEELRQRTIQLDKKIQSNPYDIQAWLDYVALQDDLGTGQKASTAEVKVGILQKALEKNPGNTKLLVEKFKLESILLEYDF